MSKETSAALSTARRALGELGPRGRTTRVPQQVRRAVVTYVEAARDAGAAWSQIVEDVGVSESALRHWRDEAGTGDQVGLLPVEVIGDKSPAVVAEARQGVGTLTLVSPGGYLVEGLGVEQLAVLLARVG